MLIREPYRSRKRGAVLRWSSFVSAILIGVLAMILALPSRSQNAPNVPAPAAAPTVQYVQPPPGQPLSTRVVAYQITARLYPETYKIEASESLTYKNLTGQPLQDFPFHLYLNAFQPKSSFIREGKRDNSAYMWKPESNGSIKVKSFEVEGGGDLTSQMKFVQPDDGNPDDQTVFQVHLPQPVKPGDSVKFNIAFEDQMPEVVARTGHVRNFFMVGQWFPKVGLFWHGKWNCHQFHHNTEFFADFGTFDVKLTLPQNEVTGAGGDLVSETNNSDGTKTLLYHSEDVHDFSWTASPDFHLVEDSWTGSAGTVKIHLLMSPGNESTRDRYLKVLKGTLAAFDEWYGPYPYDRITVVDPPHGGFSAGGMEYPTLVTADTTWFMPEGAKLPEVVLEHEFGHQYWYAMVATNEFEEAWLDEGINSYTEVKILDKLYGRDTDFADWPYLQFSERGEQRTSYLSIPEYDPLTRFAYSFVNGSSYGAVTYGKTATVLLTLEKIIGEDTMRRAVHTYFMRYRFTHPTGEDFMKTIEEVSGQDLRWYFNQAIYGTAELDYAVENVESIPEDWYAANPFSSGSSGTVYRSYVTVHRIGDFIFPQELEVKFDNGEVVHEKWDGKDRWTRFAYDKKAKIASAEINPGNQIRLDQDFFNDSYVVAADTRATRKIRDIWLFLTQWISQAAAWLT